MNKKRQRFKYLFYDFIAAMIAWALFYYSRKVLIEAKHFGNVFEIFFDRSFFLGLFLVPLFWMMIYFLSGYYNNVLRKSRLSDVLQTLFITFIGTIIVFFFVLLDDYVVDYHNYYSSFLRLFFIHFSITVIFRLRLTTITNKKVSRGEIKFNTLLIGGGKLSIETLEIIEQQKPCSGNHFVAYVAPQSNSLLSHKIPYLGNYAVIGDLLQTKNIEEVVIADAEATQDTLAFILDKLDLRNVLIKASSELYENLKRVTRVHTLFMSPLVGVSHESMPLWQQNLKKIFDVALSFFILLFISPLLVVVAIIIKITSKGPVLFSQERVGLHGKPFTLYKFRSMYVDAEKDGPCLSKQEDTRMTPFGVFLRRTKIDELPNFINVLKGDMSIVGPRPERQYFIDQIVTRAPHYLRLHKVKPGITSLGQIKYGYAGSVDEMLKRLRYDIIYIDNMSLYQDFRIIFYTFFTVMKGKGV